MFAHSEFGPKPSGSGDPAELFVGWGGADGKRVGAMHRGCGGSHPRFDDLGNRRVKRGPENPEKRGALCARSSAPGFKLLVLLLPKKGRCEEK